MPPPVPSHDETSVPTSPIIVNAVVAIWCVFTLVFMGYYFFFFKDALDDNKRLVLFVVVALGASTLLTAVLQSTGVINGKAKVGFTFTGAAAIFFFLLLLFPKLGKGAPTAIVYGVTTSDHRLPLQFLKAKADGPCDAFVRSKEEGTQWEIAVVFPPGTPNGVVHLTWYGGEQQFTVNRNDAPGRALQLDSPK